MPLDLSIDRPGEGQKNPEKFPMYVRTLFGLELV
jgi:hypothetical protein